MPAVALPSPHIDREEAVSRPSFWVGFIRLAARGNRISIGRAFKRLVDAQPPTGTEIIDGQRVMVERAGLTQQNQAVYRTVKVG